MLAGLTAALSLVLTGSLLADGGKGKKSSKKRNTIALPADAVAAYPEGIAVKGDWIYTGSSQDGTIFRARRGNKTARAISPAGAGGRTAALGMKFDKNGHLLVAGGATGTVFVIDRFGTPLGSFTRPTGAYNPASPTFLNDITVARNGDAFVTDSFSAVIYRIPAAALAASVPSGLLEEWLLLAGSPISYGPGFNLNGIVAKKNRYLLVVQTNTGKLFRISIATKAITVVTVKGTTLTGGDGMVLDDERLYVVHAGVVDVLKLKNTFRSARLRATITDPSFDSPTTAALHKGRLYVVNSQFGKLFANPVVPPTLPFTISVVKPNTGKH